MDGLAKPTNPTAQEFIEFALMPDTRFQPGNTFTPKKPRQSVDSLRELTERDMTDLQGLSMEEWRPSENIEIQAETQENASPLESVHGNK